MQIVASRDLQARIGAILDLAKREPVTVTQHGRPAVMMVPIDIGEEAVRQFNARRLAQWLADVPPAPADAPDMAEVNQLVHEMRACTA